MNEREQKKQVDDNNNNKKKKRKKIHSNWYVRYTRGVYGTACVCVRMAIDKRMFW